MKTAIQTIARKTLPACLGGLLALCALFFSAPQSHAYDLFPSILAGQTNQTAIGGTNAIITAVPGGTVNFYDIPSNAHNTNNFTAIEFVPGAAGGSRFMPIQFSFTSSAANTADVVIFFSNSIDRNNWTTNALIWTNSAAGHNQQTFINKLDTSVIPYWCVTAISNASSSVTISNMFLSAARSQKL